jgi:charged multivesicular body protein 6
MLEGNLSNQDEDEVEDELEALRLEVAPKIPEQPVLPDAPVQQPVASEPEREEVVEETRTALPA